MANRFGSAAAAGGQAKMAMMFSNFSSMILGSRSLAGYTGFAAVAPYQKDDTLQILTNNGITTPALASRVQFNLPKHSTLIGKCWAEITLTAGTTNADASDANRVFAAFDNTLPYSLPTNVAGNWPRAEYAVSPFICERLACTAE